MKKRILYFAPRKSPFVNSDIEILSDNFDVRFMAFEPKYKILIIISFIRQAWFLVTHLRPSNYVSRFGGYHSLLPSIFGLLFRVKHFIILGGTDCNSLPNIGYGNALRAPLRQFTYWSMRLSHMLLPLSKALVSAEDTFNTPPGNIGYKNNYSEILTPYEVVSLGVDTSHFRVINEIPRHPFSFVTVCSGMDQERRRRLKGVDRFMELARVFPDAEFCIIGSERPLGVQVLHNLFFIPLIEHKVLPQYFNRYNFYLQLSMAEGFSNSLIEAMACGCVPIVSNVGEMPSIVGDLGLVLTKSEIKEMADQITQFGPFANEIKKEELFFYVKTNYDITLRKTHLQRIFTSMP